MASRRPQILMAFIVDTSITAAWLMPDEVDPLAEFAHDLLIAEEGIAPSIWWLEIRNMLLVAERRHRISPDQTTALLSALEGHKIKLDRSPDEERLFWISRRHSLTIYDASYLELATRKGVPLATLDRQLARAAQREKVDLLVALSH